MDTPRRQFLVGCGTATSLMLAGCTQDNSSEETEGEINDTTDRSKSEPTEQQSVRKTTTADPTEVLWDQSATLKPDNYISTDFSISSQTQFSYRLTVENDVAVDFIVVTLEEFRSYEKRQLFTPTMSVQETTGGTGEFDLSRGNYHAVVDHTSQLGAEPPGRLEKDPAEVDIKITY